MQGRAKGCGAHVRKERRVRGARRNVYTSWKRKEKSKANASGVLEMPEQGLPIGRREAGGRGE